MILFMFNIVIENYIVVVVAVECDLMVDFFYFFFNVLNTFKLYNTNKVKYKFLKTPERCVG